MSRLIVKNLPFSVNESKLRSTFAPHGSVTDLQLKYSKDGKFRGFAFIGFKTSDEAAKAKEYIDGSYIGAAKIKVELCKEMISKQSEPDGAKTREKAKVLVDTGIDKYKADPKFNEFVSCHGKDSEGSTWGNERIDISPANVSNEEIKPEDVEEAAVTNVVSDLDYLKSKKTICDDNTKPMKIRKEFFTVKITGLPYKCKKKDIKNLFAPLKPASIRQPPKSKGFAFAGFATEKEQRTALNKHKSFLGEHQLLVYKHTEKEPEKSSSGCTSKWAMQEAALESVETVGESGRIFVRNLSYEVSEEDISELFSQYGPLTESTVPVDKLTRKFKGFAFVTFMMPEHAVAAFSALDGSTFKGRLLHLIPAKPKQEEDNSEDTNSNNYKKDKERKMKSSASNSYNWNSLFLGGDAVAEVMATQYGVDKAQVVMDEEGGSRTSAAVKLALGETEIVGQTRAFLQQQGVRLDAFSRKPDKRSKTIILAKNLPSRTSPEQLRDKFSEFGVVDRLVLPAHCLTAIIEFADPSEARAAFMKLAYTKFHNAPLYLEWAPDDTFTQPVEKGAEKKEETKVESFESNATKEDTKDDTEVEAEEGSTLFVKNLNFITTNDGMVEHFTACGNVHTATVATKKDPKTGDLLSMGFGFVTYLKKISAEKALKTLQHTKLDGHCLELKRSNRASTNMESGVNHPKKNDLGKPSTKLLVRNIPFQAKKEEIVQLFRTFGELTGVRLPRKLAGTGDHRGFAFIEFSSLSDAKAAFSSLVHSTHLYGRRLVVEWAQGEASLAELRDKTKRHWADGSSEPNKRMNMDLASKQSEAD